MKQLIVSSQHDRRLSLGYLALDWMNALIVHGIGDIEGTPLSEVPLDQELEDWVIDLYALAHNGRRLYDSAFISRAKGRDKSGQAARFALFEALGPCRFSHFAQEGESYEDPWGLGFEYVYSEGEPVGKHVTSPYVRCLATEETQAGNTYDNIYYNLNKGPLASILRRDDVGYTKVRLPNGSGEIVASTSGNASKDGGKETFVVFDETHLYTTTELKRMYNTVRRNLGKRKDAQSWSLETSTMYGLGEGSAAEESHKFAIQISEKKSRSERLYFNHRQGFESADDVDLTDEDTLRAGLKESYGPFYDVMDVDRIVNEIWDIRNPVSDSFRYWFNMSQSAEDAWLQQGEWLAVEAIDERKEVRLGERITLGFDGSRSRVRDISDATALVGCRVSDGMIFPIRVWEQPPNTKNWRVPTDEVDEVVKQALHSYQVLGFFADPAKWETWVAKWEAEYGRKLMAKSTAAHPIEWWMTGGRAKPIVDALRQFNDAVLDCELLHNGDPVLTRHVLNARRRMTTMGIQISKEHPHSSKKIDACVAAVLAFEARQQAIAKGAMRSTQLPTKVR